MFVIVISFSCIYILQGSLESCLWCDICKLPAECASERIFKIGQ